MGADIASACGQLITLKDKKDEAHQVRDIEDTGATTGPAEPPTSNRRSVSHRNDDTGEDGAKRDLEALIRPLVIATSVAATCFVVSTALFLRQRRR
jgi:hypothetical protein